MYHRSGDRFNSIPTGNAENKNNNNNINQVRRYPINNNNNNHWRSNVTNSRININPYTHSDIGFGYTTFSHSIHHGFENLDNQKIINIFPTVPVHNTAHNSSGYFRVPLRKPFNNYQKSKPGVKISAKNKAKLFKKSKMQRLKAAKRRKTNAQSSEQQNPFKHNRPRKRTARKARWKRIDLKSKKTQNLSNRPISQEKPNLSNPTSSTALVSAWLTNNFETPFSPKLYHRSFSLDTIDQSTDAVVPLYAAGLSSDLRNVEHGATSFTLPDNISIWSGMESCSMIESQELQHSKPTNFGKLLTTESLLQLEKEELVALVLSLQKQVLSDNNRTCRVSNTSTVMPYSRNSERSVDMHPSMTPNSSPYPEPGDSEISELLQSNCAEISSSQGDSSTMTETATNVSAINIKLESPSLC